MMVGNNQLEPCHNDDNKKNRNQIIGVHDNSERDDDGDDDVNDLNIDPSLREYIKEMILESDYFHDCSSSLQQIQQEDQDTADRETHRQILIETVSHFLSDDDVHHLDNKADHTALMAQRIIDTIVGTSLRKQQEQQRSLRQQQQSQVLRYRPNVGDDEGESSLQQQPGNQSATPAEAAAGFSEQTEQQQPNVLVRSKRRKDKVTPTIRNTKKDIAAASADGTSSIQQQQRQQQKLPLSSNIIMIDPSNHADWDNLADTLDTEWIQCQLTNSVWGGRGHGGRGAYANSTNSIHGNNIHLYNVSLSVSSVNGHSNTEIELLDSTRTHMDIQKHHKYGLLGRNGVGKSSLLRALAYHTIPGIPHNMRILYVHQTVDGVTTTASGTSNANDDKSMRSLSVLDSLIQSDVYRNKLLQEQTMIEDMLDQSATLEDNDEGDSNAHKEDGDGEYNHCRTGADIEKVMERLSLIDHELDRIDSDTAVDRAHQILDGLQFTSDMIHGSISNLSGGWRMRLSLARALFLKSNDLILLDEVTNHLDLAGLDWLVNYINQSDMTMILVSHDKYFLDSVCTDIIVMEHQTLTYHVGNYSMYQQQVQEKATCEAQILDAAERQRSNALSFIQKQQQSSNKKSNDPNKQRQAKMIREKKLDRIGNYREDGKRYKLRSLKTLDEKSSRLPQKVQIDIDEQPIIQLHFPSPIWSPSIGMTDSIIRMEDFSFHYKSDDPSTAPKAILSDLTLYLNRGSKIALVGPNGCGKSTIMKLLAGDHANNVDVRGTLWIHPKIRIGHVSQYAVEELETYANCTVLEYAEEHIVNGRAASDIIKKASGNVRQYLGGFGLGGKHSLQRIGKLSGGERMRLCFAAVLADNPHVLLLDESTNHCDIQLLESMSNALNDFMGTVLMVSHNQSFLSGFCNQLWVLHNGHITSTHNDTETFDEMFTKYRCNISTNDKGKASLVDQRRSKTVLAKRATSQRTGTKQSTALF